MTTSTALAIAPSHNMIEAVGEDFFEPVNESKVEALLSNYQDQLERVRTLSKLLSSGGYSNAHRMLTKKSESSLGSPLNSLEVAENNLRADYWDSLLNLTDLRENMSSARREIWTNMIQTHKSESDERIPDFTDSVVIPSLVGMLSDRGKFWAERVHSIFKSLSGQHVTNQPHAFSKRMIFSVERYNSLCSTKSGHIHDLRFAISKIRRSPLPRDTYSLLRSMENRGLFNQWVEIDGGAIRLKLFKKLTVHVEVHPEMAWRLNSILAEEYGAAIPATLRRKPTKQRNAKALQLREVSLSSYLREVLLDELSVSKLEDGNYQVHNFRYPSQKEEQAIDELMMALGAIVGPVLEQPLHFSQGTMKRRSWLFPFDPEHLFTEVASIGSIPEKQSHQFYPTNDQLADDAVDWAEIEDQHSKLEPSAGVGNLVRRMGPNVDAVEISELHCKVLSKYDGVDVIRDDFLAWSKRTTKRYDRIVMNPPFTDGHALAHTEAAANLLMPGGVLVAVLPSTVKGKIAKLAIPAGIEVEESEPREENFAGTVVSVRLVRLTLN